MSESAATETELLPPDESFWKRYSPRHEFPIAGSASTLMHLLALGVVILAALAMSWHWYGETTQPPAMSVVYLRGNRPATVSRSAAAAGRPTKSQGTEERRDALADAAAAQRADAAAADADRADADRSADRRGARFRSRRDGSRERCRQGVREGAGRVRDAAAAAEKAERQQPARSAAAPEPAAGSALARGPASALGVGPGHRDRPGAGDRRSRCEPRSSPIAGTSTRAARRATGSRSSPPWASRSASPTSRTTSTSSRT